MPPAPSLAAAPAVRVEVVPGFPAELDALAKRAVGARGFLRAAWFAAAGDGETLIARRAGGQPFLAIPTVRALIGVRSVPGSYWPFRSVLLADDATAAELAAAFAAPAARAALAQAWRLGPVYAEDPTIPRLKYAAGRAGWTVLARDAGRTHLFDLAAMAEDRAWPRRSTRRRLANYERQLAERGAVAIRHVTGADWSEDAFAAMAAVEANSWIAHRTDGSGAKFLNAAQCALWRRAVADPALAEALSATILTVAGEAIAFSFDLRAGDLQYAIASSYDERFAAFRPGKLVTYRQLDRALADGVRTVDLGAGDSGYKREMGAAPGSPLIDLLIVRSRPAASLLQLKWGGESAIGRAGFLAAAAERGPRARLEPWLAAGAMAAAALAFSE